MRRGGNDSGARRGTKAGERIKEKKVDEYGVKRFIENGLIAVDHGVEFMKRCMSGHGGCPARQQMNGRWNHGK